MKVFRAGASAGNHEDLSGNDVSWHNGDIITPHLETLADSGIKLNQFYAQPTCSPSRAALLTGLYPIHNGFNLKHYHKTNQHLVRNYN